MVVRRILRYLIYSYRFGPSSRIRPPRIGLMPTGLLRATVARIDAAVAYGTAKIGDIKMPVKILELKTFTRDEWLALDKQTLKDQLEILDSEYPLELYTDASRTYSTVRRMKTEKKIGLPINLRSGCAISVETGKAANTMTEDEWEKFCRVGGGAH